MKNYLVSQDGVPNFEDLCKTIDSMFQYALDHKNVLEDRNIYEQLTLKYISFLTSFRYNQPRAYYVLKTSLASKSD